MGGGGGALKVIPQNKLLMVYKNRELLRSSVEHICLPTDHQQHSHGDGFGRGC